MDAAVLDLHRPEHAVVQLAVVLDRVRNRSSLVAENEVLARQMVDETIRGGGYLLAVLPGGTVLTGANAPGIPNWDREHANALRWRLDDTGHETVTVETPLGPVVVAEHRTAAVTQLQAFLTEPDITDDVLVVTLTAARSSRGWDTYRTAFLHMVHTATRHT